MKEISNGIIHVKWEPDGVGPWLNWHINRGRIQHDFTKSELRRISWRRAK